MANNDTRSILQAIVPYHPLYQNFTALDDFRRGEQELLRRGSGECVPQRGRIRLEAKFCRERSGSATDHTEKGGHFRPNRSTSR